MGRGGAGAPSLPGQAFRARSSGRRKTQDSLEGPCLLGARVVGETEGRASETPPRMDGWLPCQRRLLSGIRASLQLELLEGSEGFEEPRSRPEFQCASARRTDGCTHLQRRRSLRHRLHLPLLRCTFSPSLRPPSTDPKPAEPSGGFRLFQPQTRLNIHPPVSTSPSRRSVACLFLRRRERVDV